MDMGGGNLMEPGMMMDMGLDGLSQGLDLNMMGGPLDVSPVPLNTVSTRSNSPRLLPSVSPG